MYRNRTEPARRHLLHQRGIGNSREAVEARRVRERRNRQNLIREGEMLPGWITGGLVDQENIDSFLGDLDASARSKAISLLGDLDTTIDLGTPAIEE